MPNEPQASVADLTAGLTHHLKTSPPTQHEHGQTTEATGEVPESMRLPSVATTNSESA